MQSRQTSRGGADALPLDFRLAGPMIDGAREHEQQIGQPIDVREHLRIDAICAKRHDRTFGELPDRVKRSISHRSRAAIAVVRYLLDFIAV